MFYSSVKSESYHMIQVSSWTREICGYDEHGHPRGSSACWIQSNGHSSLQSLANDGITVEMLQRKECSKCMCIPMSLTYLHIQTAKPCQSCKARSTNNIYLRYMCKYVNIPSEKYFYVHIYVCICVYTYLCKMDEYRSYASLS